MMGVVLGPDSLDVLVLLFGEQTGAVVNALYPARVPVRAAALLELLDGQDGPEVTAEALQAALGRLQRAGVVNVLGSHQEPSYTVDRWRVDTLLDTAARWLRN